MNETTDHGATNDLADRVTWLEHERLTPYQRFLLLLLQVSLPAFGGFTIITSATLWIVAGPSQALANVKLFVHISVATIMGVAFLAWLAMTVANLVLRWRSDSLLK